MENQAGKYTYKHTVHACYTGYITQAIINNLTPLLFTIFQTEFGITFEEVGRLILINFGVQICADVFSVRYVDKIGYRRSAMAAHILCVAGLACLAVLPHILPPYAGLVTAVVIYALGGGLLEVLVSPIVDSLPGDSKAGAMSLLHSFYCWGQVAVVLLTTLFVKLAGSQLWPALPLLWALVPFYNIFRFAKVPLVPPLEEEKLMTVRELVKNKIFIAALLLMLSAGASELIMSQWSSLFAEKGLGVSKMLGDLLGPCLFAVFMGIGRTVYGFWGEKLNLKRVLAVCGALCVACYLVTVFSPWPIFSLLGCALTGLSVSLMWPGVFSLSSRTFPRGGTAMFGMLAIFGDLGGSLGPWLSGVVSDVSQKLPVVSRWAASTGEALSQAGLKSGILAGTLFPLLLLVGLAMFRVRREKQSL